MNKLTDSKLSTLSEYLQSHQEKSSLSLKIKFNANKQQNLQFMKIIEEELGKLTCLTDLALHISKQSILTVVGYNILSSTVLNLNELKKLSIKIDRECYLENEGLNILQDMINHLPELIYLKLEIKEINYITAETSQRFLDSLINNTKLTTLSLKFQDHQSTTTNEGSLHFWRGLGNLNNLEKLRISLSTHNYSSSDLIELFEHIANLKKLSSLHLIFYQFSNYLQDPYLLDELFPQIGKMTELRSLKIDYGLDKNILNESQRRIILRNLSNLKSLEKLKLYALEQLLMNFSFGEDANIVRDMKPIKWEIKNRIENICPGQLISMGQNLLELKNLINLELMITLDGDQLSLFLLELSESFSQMNSLLNLVLEFKCRINTAGYSVLGGSFMHIKTLEKLDLQFIESYFNTNKSGTLHGIRYLKNLKDLKIIMNDHEMKGEEEVSMIDSILQLKMLEKLYLENLSGFEKKETGMSRLHRLGTTLANLRKLKYLKCGFQIGNLETQSKLDELEKCIENLSDLECLDLNLNIRFKNKKLIQERPLINSFTNLKKLIIKFENIHLNILGLSSSAPYLSKLEDCSFSFNERIEAQDFLQLLGSLSQSNLRKLNLTTKNLSDCQGYKEQFEMAFSNLRNLEKLKILEKGDSSLMVYIHGIKHLKQLRSLNLEFTNITWTYSDTQELDLCLKQLTNLQKLKGKIFLGESDISQFESFASFRNLKSFEFDYRYSIKDENLRKIIDFKQVCSLDLDQLNPKSCSINTNTQRSNSNLFEDQQSSLGQKDKCEDNLSVANQEINATKLIYRSQHTNYKQSAFTLNQFDFHHSPYLNELAIQLAFDNKSRVAQLEITQPLRDLTSESKLLVLKFQFLRLIFSEEQIRYLSRNFQFLNSLQQFSFNLDNFQNYYHLLFDSFKYLINLQDLTVKTNLSENGAISLGNSLQTLSQLQLCQFSFSKESTIEHQGISSIFRGLKQTKKLKKLEINIEQTAAVEEDSQPLISESLSNLKLLQDFRFSLGIHRIDQTCLREFFPSIGSLVFLKTLELKMNKENPLSQDMLDQLIKAMNKVIYLSYYNISINLESNPSISLSQEFATLFNINPKSKLTIITHNDNFVFLKQLKCSFMLNLQSLDNIKVDFLEYLNESIELLFEIGENNNILKDIPICKALKVNLRFDSLRNQQDIDYVCRFMSKVPKTFQLEMYATISDNLNIEETMRNIAQSLTQLQSVKVLILQFIVNGSSGISFNDLKIILNSLKKGNNQLQELYLKTKNEEVNRQMIGQIKRSILRQVKLDSFKQSY